MNEAATRHFLDLGDFTGRSSAGVLDAAAAIKSNRKGEMAASVRSPARCWQWCSTSLDAHPRLLRRRHARARRRDAHAHRQGDAARPRRDHRDTARVLSRYVDAIMIRTLDHEMVVELARHATIPVINGLTKLTIPAR